MDLSTKEWVTLHECVHALASMRGALPVESIEQWLVAAIRSGRITARRRGEKYPPKGLHFPIRGGILDRYDVEVRTEAVLALLGNPKVRKENRKAGRPEREATIARSEIQSLYPSGVPHGMKNATLAAEVQASLTAKGAGRTPSPRTIDKVRAELDAQQ